MDWVPLGLLAVAGAIILALCVYWLLWISEGAYLGARVVRWLYDCGARSYDQVKQYDPLEEAAFLANPLFSRLDEEFGAHSLLLDVATGTARLPLALLAIPFYEGQIVGLDLSREMLAEAARKCRGHEERVTLVHHPAVPLPWDDATFDAVASLEALEFMPDRHAALREMVRVLRPGGWLLTSNRIGVDATLLPGRTDRPAVREEFLASLGLEEIFTRPWQSYYDLVFARKAGTAQPAQADPARWRKALRCPHCGANKGSPTPTEAWRCALCATVIEVGADGVWELLR